MTLRNLKTNVSGTLQQIIRSNDPIFIETSTTHITENKNFLNYQSDFKTAINNNLIKPNNSLKTPSNTEFSETFDLCKKILIKFYQTVHYNYRYFEFRLSAILIQRKIKNINELLMHLRHSLIPEQITTRLDVKL